MRDISIDADAREDAGGRSRGHRTPLRYLLTVLPAEWQQAPVLRDVPVPDPGAGRFSCVLPRPVHATPACTSWNFPPAPCPWQPPFTLGHENARR